MAQHHSVTITANMPICTHLSNHILSSQFSFGKEEPGSVSKIAEIISQVMAGINEGFILFNDIISAILAQEVYIQRSPIRGPLFNQL